MRLDDSVNQIALSATVLDVKPLRYTPAGLPALEMVLEHDSDVQQAGHQRRIQLNVSAVALGDIALLLADITLGTPMLIKGFLAPSRKGSSKLIVHIQHADRLSPEFGMAVV